MEKEQQEAPTPSKSWSLLPMNKDAFASAQDRARTRKTISSEVVTAFVDGLVNQMRLGVGGRGVDPERLVASIKTLKGLLDANKLSLGSTSWNLVALCQRNGPKYYFESLNLPPDSGWKSALQMRLLRQIRKFPTFLSLQRYH